MGLLDTIQQQFGPSAIAAVSQRLGIDPAKAQSVINMALPAVVAGMARHASHPSGEAQIHNETEQRGAAVPVPQDSVQGPTSTAPGSASSETEAGRSGGFLDRVLGTHADLVRQKIGDATGTDPKNADKLVMVLAPMVVAAIAHERTRQNNATAGQLLQQASAQASQR